MKSIITILFIFIATSLKAQIIRANGYYVSPTVVCKILNSDSIPAFSFSFRKINTCTYAGYCIKVRRASDNTTSDIGFLAGYVDTVALKSFIGSSDAFVQTGFDQSGNGRDVTQATLSMQPKIATAGALIYANDGTHKFLAMQFDGVNDILVYTFGASYGVFSFFGVSKRVSGLFDPIAFGQSASVNVAILRNNNSTTQAMSAYNITTAATGTANLNANFCGGVFTLSSLFSTDGNTTATSSATGGTYFNALALGGTARISPIYTSGLLCEAIAYLKDMTSSYTLIQSNIKTYYGL